MVLDTPHWEHCSLFQRFWRAWQIFTPFNWSHHLRLIILKQQLVEPRIGGRHQHVDPQVALFAIQCAQIDDFLISFSLLGPHLKQFIAWYSTWGKIKEHRQKYYIDFKLPCCAGQGIQLADPEFMEPLPLYYMISLFFPLRRSGSMVIMSLDFLGYTVFRSDNIEHLFSFQAMNNAIGAWSLWLTGCWWNHCWIGLTEHQKQKFKSIEHIVVELTGSLQYIPCGLYPPEHNCLVYQNYSKFHKCFILLQLSLPVTEQWLKWLESFVVLCL